MPINTQGHQVQVMPVYSPLDPNRVTFNPMGFTQGALSSIELMDALAKRQAFAQQQAELAATREGRLGAANATNLATIDLAPQQNLADIALAQQRAAVAPGQTEAVLANQEFQKYLRPMVQNVERIKTESDELLAPQRSDMATRQVALDEEKQAREKEAAPLEHQVRLIKLNQDIEFIANDKTMNDAQKIATIRNLNASALQSEAAARRADRDEGKQPEDPIKKLAEVTLQIQRLEKGEVVGSVDGEQSKMPILDYQATTLNPDGSQIASTPNKILGLIPWGTNQVTRNPEADRRTAELKRLYDLRNQLTAQVTGGVVAPAAQASPAPAKSSSGAKNITTQAEFNALKPGESFIFNGKQGIKTK